MESLIGKLFVRKELKKNHSKVQREKEPAKKIMTGPEGKNKKATNHSSILGSCTLKKLLMSNREL